MGPTSCPAVLCQTAEEGIRRSPSLVRKPGNPKMLLLLSGTCRSRRWVPAMESRGGAGGASWCDRLKSGAGLHSQITSKILSSFPDKGDFGAEKVEPGQVAALSTRPRCCYFRAAAEGEAEQCWKVGAP